MSEQPAGVILAIVTQQAAGVGGGAPIFYVQDEAEQQKVASYLASILDANVHDLENGSLILVKH